MTLRDGYAWADGTDSAKTYRFYNYLSKLHTLTTAPNAPEENALYGEASAVLTAIEALFDTANTEYAVTINGVEYTYSSGADGSCKDADGNELTLDSGTYTVVLVLGEDHDGTYEIAGYCSVCDTRVSVSFTLEDAESYASGDVAWQKANLNLYGIFVAYGFKFDFETYYLSYGAWDCTAGYTVYVDGEEVDLDAVAAADGQTLTIGGVTITYDGSSKYTFAFVAEDVEAGTYTIEFVLDDGYAWKTDGTTADLTYTFIVYEGTATKPTPDSTIWGGTNNNQDANGDYFTDTATAAEKTLVTIAEDALDGYTVYVDGEKVDLATMEEGTVTIGGVKITYADSKYTFAFIENVEAGTCDGYAFDYWYGEDGTHVTETMDEFLGDEKVTFTEESLLGLELYYVTGEVDPDGTPSSSDETTEVVYVYLMDPVYGTVCVYQLGTGDTINGSTVDSIDPTYENTFENVTYDFDTDLGIYFYQSTDYICDDWSVLTEDDQGYDADSENMFSYILAHTDCTSGPVAIGYFECATCGTYVPVYASAAHTFGDDGLNMEAPATDSSTYNGYTVTINDVEYTYDAGSYKDADGNELALEAGTTYTVVLALAGDYDAWSDGTTVAKDYTFDVFSNMATAPSDPETTYGDASAVLGYIKALFDTNTEASWTVTINGVEYTYNNDESKYVDADGNELTEDALTAGTTYTVVLALADGYDAWDDGTTVAKDYTFDVFSNMATAPTAPTTTYGNASDVLSAIEDLFDKTGSWTVTINGVEYTYNNDDGDKYDYTGGTVSVRWR